MSEKDYPLEYWVKKAEEDKKLPIGIKYRVGYFDWLIWSATRDKKRPISELIKEAIKTDKENKKFDKLMSPRPRDKIVAGVQKE